MANKANAGSASTVAGTGISGAIVGLFVSGCWPGANVEDVTYLNTIVTAVLAGVATWFSVYHATPDSFGPDPPGPTAPPEPKP